MEAVFALGVIVAGKLWLRFVFRKVKTQETLDSQTSSEENLSARRPDEG